ncbi:hypothetical protein EMIHUDRAFT_254012 [Emiliania huxleyi CCMP1516]|uniref:Obg domain-containing protein n=2 Tax=Emiliania huxleyi TaxID=2903 RepID=A0A0D3JZK2_EMIH1|nr:hypothetical protein EMIHUDRAFT_254012 [Emiliania huxleyi CCMP1516]EOD28937.1 hypothetical protein EMIHUDRAFT_254012 [Emiliania huxleyi CCMP1516]|eukprot:XP_005781366.1 hypothetical protein EMIHUDRAFT_254012 [Emiliania huxleyi CCMP1516]
MSTGCCNEEQQYFLVTIFAYSGAVLLLWRALVFKPFKLFAVALHEFCHAAAAAALHNHMTSIASYKIPRAGSPPARRATALRAAEPAEELDRMFFDRAELFVRSGAGGVGAVSMNGQRPVGGNGGAGGDVVLLCDGSLNTLGHLRGRASVRGDRGDDARGKESGRSAREAIVRVPPNCRVSELESGDAVGELREPGERLLIAAGGQGGEGNGDGYRRTRDSRRNYPPGGSTRARLLLSMTLVADVGLIGHPNAGKSGLAALTFATSAFMKTL